MFLTKGSTYTPGVLKVMFLMSSNTPVTVSLGVFGLPPVLGAYLTLMPAAVGLALLAKTCVEKGWHASRWFLPVALSATLVLLIVSRLDPSSAFAAPHSPTLRASTTTVTIFSTIEQR